MAIRCYHNTGDNAEIGVYDEALDFQTFTPDVTFTCSTIKVKMNRNYPGVDTVIVSIRDAAAGKPTGPDLTSESFTTEILPEQPSAGVWVELVLSVPIILYGSTQYALVVGCPTNSSEVSHPEWRGEYNPGNYPGGTFGASDDGGSTWTINSLWDTMFELWDDEDLAIPGPSLTRVQALDEILTPFKTAWDAEEDADLVKYDNVPNDQVPPATAMPWARVAVRHTTSDQASLCGALGTQRWKRKGVLVVQIFELTGQGLIGTTDLPKIIQDAYEGVRTVGGVWFTKVTINEIGPDGDFYQTNVTASFEYDEIK